MHSFDNDNRTASIQSKQQMGFETTQSWKSKKVAKSKPEAVSFDSVLQNNDIPRTAQPLNPPEKVEGSYDFNDVIDVVNPLHHLPVIGMLYREMTGDEIKPASQIIGGGLFGGPLGALTGTVNAVSEIQTGKDLPNTVLAMAGLSGEKETLSSNSDDPETRLNLIAESFDKLNPAQDLPGTALAFVNLAETGKAYTKTSIADGRTAGSQFVEAQNVAYTTPNKINNTVPEIKLDRMSYKREAMTEISLSPMPR